MFMFTKSLKYFYDTDSCREPLALNTGKKTDSTETTFKHEQGAPGQTSQSFGRKGHSGYYRKDGTPLFNPLGRNLRSVWTINPSAYKDAHFATFPISLVEPCIKLGTSEFGCCPVCGEPWKRTKEQSWIPKCKCGETNRVPCVVLDPFAGSGTTLMVAKKLGRKYVGFEMQEKYSNLIEKRLRELK
jgi:site-specific DNA-methyltransferase (adenine-specific)